MKMPLPRFSLMTLLLAAVIIGMGIVIARLWHEVGPLRAEVDRRAEGAGR